jgi:hydroxypyruvate isomerase
MLFTEVGLLERFSRAAKSGFRGVEIQFPYAHTIGAIGEQLERNGLALVLHNLPAGDWANGERGIACLPDRVGEFQDSVGRAIAYASGLRCRQLNCLAGLAPEGAPRDRLRTTLVDNLRFAAKKTKEAGITLLVEPLNTRDTPGFFLHDSSQAVEIIDEVGRDNVSLQFDAYHAHVMEGDVVASLQRNLSHIAHVQIADDPGRHEPGTGCIDFASLFRVLDSARYAGWIGCEYVPSNTTEESLEWLGAYFSFPSSAS